ncbi:hypothetical protein GGI11_004449 [Coemansia sp. RSA 2049]|nr:hypothetical protein GGI11_004449 [Coemansia sp. RSA 2049]
MVRRYYTAAWLVAAMACSARVVQGACGFDTVDVTTSPGFTITVNDDYKVVEDAVGKTAYGLYCGDSQPTGVDGVDKWFHVPVQSVGIRIPAASGFLEALGKSSAIAAAANPAQLTNICVDTSKLATLGEDTSESSSSSSESEGESTGTDPSVDVVFSDTTDSDGGAKTVRLPSDDSLTPLQKAEWIKVVAAFFNEEKSADTLFTSISDAYECHRSNLQHLSGPSHVYWVEYNGGTKPTYNIVDTPYQKELLVATGATNTTKTPLSDPTDQAAFHDAVKDAEFVVDQTDLKNYGMRASEWYEDFGYASDTTQSSPADAKFLLQRNIWRTDGYTSKTGVSNFPEFAYARPDLVLQDLISVFEPTYNTSYRRHWMLWLGGTNEDAVTIDSSNYDCKSPWLAQVASCSARSDFTGDDSDAAASASDGSEKDADDDNGNDEAGNEKDTDDDNEPSEKSGSSRAGKIAGGVIGAAALVVLVIVAMHYINRHRRRARIRALSGASELGAESFGLHETRRPRIYS